MRLVGYADRWTARPGDIVGLHVSSRTSQVDISVLRMRHGDDNPAGPGFLATDVECAVSGRYACDWHDVPAGSYAIVENVEGLFDAQALSFSVWVCPTASGKRPQSILACCQDGFRLGLDGQGRPFAAFGGGEAVGPAALLDRQWYLLVVTIDMLGGTLELHVSPRDEWPGAPGRASAAARIQNGATWSGPLIMAAAPGSSGTIDHFSGKLDSPTVYDKALLADEVRELESGREPAGVVGRWDFSGDQAALVVPSDCGRRVARLERMPARGVTGHRARGDALNPVTRPHCFTAIHFHEDDKHDAGWPTTLELKVPEGWSSGIYAFHLRSEAGDEDYVPFFVLPGTAQRKSEIAFLVPTFSYLAYGNSHFSHSLPDPALLAVLLSEAQPYQLYVREQRLNSSYDEHPDGSGVFYTSRLLPQVNVRPKQLGSNGAPHQFNADMHLVDWLHAKEFEHDVLTDEALHIEGLPLLQDYKVIMTGTHPEYWSGTMLEALEAYLAGGGHVIYMGGNGFYWVTSIHPHAPHVIEVRRFGGTRTWTTDPEERHHSTTGEMGGTWRDRGRAPNRLVGIGFAGQGYATNGVFQRAEASYKGPLAKLFDGIKNDVIGDTPSLVWGHGAAGFEVDRIDYSLGSPPSTVCLASSHEHGEYYQLVYEEALAHMTPAQLTDANPKLRGDISYLSYPSGGAVFSTGSITFGGVLSHNEYDNDASKLLENVVNHFLA